MKNNFSIGIIVVPICLLVQSCSVFSNQKKSPEYAVDLVCGMKVDKAEAYTSKYKQNKFYFDNYNCKHSFTMNPEKFINNQCINPNDTIPKK
jgi:YHS domain-containing protein